MFIVYDIVEYETHFSKINKTKNMHVFEQMMCLNDSMTPYCVWIILNK